MFVVSRPLWIAKEKDKHLTGPVPLILLEKELISLRALVIMAMRSEISRRSKKKIAYNKESLTECFL